MLWLTLGIKALNQTSLTLHSNGMRILSIMAANIIPLKWKRPESIEYPKVWHRFKACDLNSEELVEYRVEDLCSGKAHEAYKHMWENYLKDDPMSQAMRKFAMQVNFHSTILYECFNSCEKKIYSSCCMC